MSLWIFLRNIFLNVTENNYKLMYIISEFHLSALQSKAGDAFFDNLIAFYTPFHTSYETAYSAWKNSGAKRQDSTLNVTQLLGQTRTKLNIWQPAIQTVYPVNTNGYLRFFPDGRAPFTRGETGPRIAAFKQLDDALTGEAALAAVKTSVHDFYDNLHTARTAQESNKTGTGAGSAEVEKLRTQAAIAMYSDFLDLLKHFIPNQEQAALYIDEEHIKNHEQLLYTGTAPENEAENILKHKFDPLTEKLRGKSTGNKTISLFFANSAAALPATGQPSLTLAAGQEQTINPVDAGYADDKRYLNVYNAGTGEAKWEVEIE